jgi:hypothetical protein
VNADKKLLEAALLISDNQKKLEIAGDVIGRMEKRAKSNSEPSRRKLRNLLKSLPASETVTALFTRLKELQRLGEEMNHWQTSAEERKKGIRRRALRRIRAAEEKGETPTQRDLRLKEEQEDIDADAFIAEQDEIFLAEYRATHPQFGKFSDDDVRPIMQRDIHEKKFAPSTPPVELQVESQVASTPTPETHTELERQAAIENARLRHTLPPAWATEKPKPELPSDIQKSGKDLYTPPDSTPDIRSDIAPHAMVGFCKWCMQTDTLTKCGADGFLCSVCAPMWREREASDTFKPPARQPYVEPTLRIQPPKPFVVLPRTTLIEEQTRRQQAEREAAAEAERQRKADREEKIRNVGSLSLEQQMKLLIG